MPSAILCPYFQKAFGWSVPIGGLAGLVGLGGGEFRLPVLMYVVGYPARTAVPLNLAVSLITLTFALVVRSRAVSVAALVPYLNEVAGLAVGGVASAFYGARFVSARGSARSRTRMDNRCEKGVWNSKVTVPDTFSGPSGTGPQNSSSIGLPSSIM